MTASPLFSTPLKLPCGAELPNRLAKAAMTEGLADGHNRASDALCQLYGRWAQGGAGLLITGNVQVDRTHLERPGNLVIDGNGGFDQLRAMALAGTSGGNHLWMQINHPGRQTPGYINPAPLAPSAVAVESSDFGYAPPVAMTEAQILDVIARFAHVASAARDAGFTGVQVHAAHGYLLSEFLSPLVNQRTDAWGGSLENRARALIEIVRGVRQAVGADFPVSVKLNSADFQKGGFTDEESMTVVEWLGAEKVDLIEISGGNAESWGDIVNATNAAVAEKKESTRLREAYFSEYAKKVRPIAKVPLMITGGWRTPVAMETALEADILDVIGLGRPLCADPDICAKVLAGAESLLPSPERTVTLDRAVLAEPVSDRAYATLKSFAHEAWCYIQLLRLGAGLDPDLELTGADALRRFESNEQEALAGLVDR